MGASNSKPESETINWNCIKTENVSSQAPNLNLLSNDAKRLIASLNIPEITESPVSEFNVEFILDKINNGLNRQDRNNFNKILENISSKSANNLSDNNCGSDTSPFISSEMYEYIFRNSRNQMGGGKKNKKAKKQGKKKNKKGGSLEIDEDDSSTSSTSSDSDLEDILDSTEEDVVAAKKKKEHMKHENKE